ncbi:MAG: hypothetical protein HC866_14995 [Leptolyngbyaceae cyanobacterium RU_5_1]|nr:hypothetical protein [Leptolyngbyaceae cyanobacterium RU_5_1]
MQISDRPNPITNPTLRVYYSLIWRSAARVKPKQLLEWRPFDPYYYPRPEDDRICQAWPIEKTC